ncbi:TetR/AcrR family transcriptional regulator [Termitidicoccus mucosus]
MSSNKANGKRRGAIIPQRSHGKARVGALLEAAAGVIAEKGYDAATMAEIAARAKSPIGSLYRFFPNKETLANALLDRYAVLINKAFDVIDETAASVSIEELADRILNLMVNLQGETKALFSVLEAHAEWTRRLKFPEIVHNRLVKTLLLCAPDLPMGDAKNMAIVLMHNLKTMKAIVFGQGIATGPDAAAELSLMNRLYLLDKLGQKKK